jgi:hypothetical protein
MAPEEEQRFPHNDGSAYTNPIEEKAINEAHHQTTSDMTEEAAAQTSEPTTEGVPDATEVTTMADLPPEAQGEANGGPLGCCLGLVVGVFLTALLITTGSLILGNGGFLGIATVPVLALGTILGGYFGWKIGKRLYREYDTPVVDDEQQSATMHTRHAHK